MGLIVGREHELEILCSELTGAGTRVVLLTGEAGSGKTRLLAEVPRLGGDRFVVGLQGFQPEQAAALLAARPLLASLAGLDPRLEQALLDDAPGATLHLFELTQRALGAVGRPVVLVVDDEQWLDETTRALLHYLVRASSAEQGDLALIVAGRPSPTIRQMEESFLGVLGGPAMRALAVPPLDRTSGVELALRLDASLTPSGAAEHWQRAGGSPFWLTLLSTGGQGSLDGLLQQRITSCDPAARGLLELLGVAARPFEVADLAHVAGLSTDVTQRALSDLADQGLVRERSGVVTVVHDLVRDAVLAETPPATLRLRRLQVADWLSEGQDPAMLLAAIHHRTAAGEEFDQLVERILTSDRRAWLGADGAAQLVEVVLHRSHAHPRRLAALAGLAEEVGEARLAERLWSRVARGEAPEELRLRACIGAGRAAFEGVDLPGAREWLRRARGFEAADTSSRVAVEVLESDILRWLEGNFDEAACRSERAMAIVAETPAGLRPGPTVDALCALADDAMVRGDVAAMARCADQLEECSGDHLQVRHRALLYRLTAVQLQGEPRRALDLLTPHWQAAVASGSPARQVALGGYQVNLLVSTGRLDEAKQVAVRLDRLLERMADQHRRLSVGISVSHVRLALLELELLTGDWRVALAGLTKQLEDVTPHDGILWAATTAEWCARLSSPQDPEVDELVGRSAAFGDQVACPRCRERARLATSQLRARSGDLAGARSTLDAWSRRPDAPASVLRVAAVARAQVLALEKRHTESRHVFAEVELELARSGAVLERMWLLVDRARSLGQFDPAGSAAACQEVLAWAHEVGAPNLALVARRGLSSLGVRLWRRTATAGDNLTEREIQVVELVSEGLTNPEIADRLYLSRKTVERHVSQALAKLGARNRTELATAWRGRRTTGEVREFPDDTRASAP